MCEPVTLRFYAELNDHFPASGGRLIEVATDAENEVGVLIEACGVPLVEVDLIVVDGESVGRAHRVAPGDRVGVYPVFESFDIAPEIRLRSRSLRVTRFLVEADLDPLAGLLRQLGYDARLSQSPLTDHLDLARDEGRIVLSTDPRVIADPAVSRGLLVKALEPMDQLGEVAARLQLSTGGWT